ncbi:MAG: 4Fe-4S binding protein [Spirochaetia bacterium]|nr:4Fe-4S binding protein [Spirochaetia bacterium]
MKSPLWSKIRAYVQLLFWFIFVFLLIYSRDPVDNTFLYNLFSKLSFHLSLSTSLSSLKFAESFFYSSVIIFLTIFLGRFFCGWICPLGITIDASDKKLIKNKSSVFSIQKKIIKIKHYKYGILLISLILSLAGFQAAGIIDPLSLVYRSYTVSLYAYFDRLIRILFDVLYYIPGINYLSEPVYDILKDKVLDFNLVEFENHIPVFLLFLIIILLSYLARRFWCQSLCPLGAIFSLVSRFSFFQRHVDAALCNSCLKCQNSCRMNAIYDGGQKTYESECIKCFECLKSCPSKAASFKFNVPFANKEKPIENKQINTPQIFTSRKSLMKSFFAALLLLPFFNINTNRRTNFTYIIRPPGAKREDEFIKECIRCAQCIKICPTNALHPIFLEAGLTAMFTPRLVPRLGYCEKNCNLCSKICPTDALFKIKKSDKDKTIIGTAYFVKDRCIPYSEGINCMVCEEMCPTSDKAIKFKDEIVLNKQGKKVQVKIPYVIENLCIGCGICENKCPVTGDAAIQVTTPKSAEGINRF